MSGMMKRGDGILAVDSDRGELSIRFECKWIGEGAKEVLLAFAPHADGRGCEKTLHRDDLVELTGMRGSSVVMAGHSLVGRGLALWDSEVGTDALHLNDFGLVVAIWLRKGGDV